MRLAFLWWLVLLAVYCLDKVLCTHLPKEALIQVESNLRTLLGIKSRPKVDRTKIVLPQYLVDLYNTQTGSKLSSTNFKKPGMHTESANTIRSFAHIETPIDARFTTHHKFRLMFDVTQLDKNEELKAAELQINRDVAEQISTDESDSYLRIFIIDILKPGRKGKIEPITRVIDSKLIDVRENKTISVDVLPAVERWLQDPKSNHGVLISVHGVTGKVKKHLRLKRDLGEDWSHKQPILYTYTDDRKYKQRTGREILDQRRKRMAKKRKKLDRRREPCKRHPMHVDFNHVGWSDWIMAPEGYDAFFCKGECNFPLAEHLNTTNHAIVQALINSVSPTKVSKPCCVPTQLSSISMLYVDDGNQVTLKNYRDMVVTGCGCR